MLEVSEAGRRFTQEELKDEVQTLISAVSVVDHKCTQETSTICLLKGSDTIAGTVSFVLMMLGMHPKIQVQSCSSTYQRIL